VLERERDLRVSESYEGVTRERVCVLRERVCVLREREREEKRDLEGKWQNLLNLEECGSVR
jgi:hypothetical protein